MIAISVLFAWVALAAAAFLMLSALGRVADRRDHEAQIGLLGNGETRTMVGRVQHISLPEGTAWHPARRLLDSSMELSSVGSPS
jgi:hypothetical protein